MVQLLKSMEELGLDCMTQHDIRNSVASEGGARKSSMLLAVFNRLNPIVFFFVNGTIKWTNWLLGRKRVLIYTDSRGFEVTKAWNRKNPMSSYIRKFQLHYSCDVQLCPRKFTSLLDFLEFWETRVNCDYEYVILHCGIVDFAPRPMNSYSEMYSSKIKLIERYNLAGVLANDQAAEGQRYCGELTRAFLTEEAVQSVIIPKLVSVPGLIYVGINRVLSDWDGMYWRKRPGNINDQLILSRKLETQLPMSIDLSDWSDIEIRRFTSDNVHLNQLGFNYVYRQIGKQILLREQERERPRT